MRERLVLAATAALLAAACFEGGAVTWIGLGALLYALALGLPVLLGLAPRPALSRTGLAALGLLAAFVAWNGLSVWWSVLPDRTWGYLNLGLVYLVFAAGGVLAGTLLPGGARTVAGVLAAVLGAVVCWSLAGKVFPGLYPDYQRVARLRGPVDYWNALALLGDFALPLGLWLGGRRTHRAPVRAAGALLLYGWVVAILLAFSRGGLLVAVAAVALWFALDRERLESFGTLVAGGVPAAAVAAVAFRLPGIADDGQSAAVRAHDGWIFGVLLVGAAALVAAAQLLAARRPIAAERRRLAGRVALVLAVLAAVAGAVALGLAAPRLWHDFSSSQPVASGGARFGSAASNFRLTWWKRAAHGFADRPVLGSGAGSFEYWNLRLRTTSFDDTIEPHDLPLQFLSETGIVGFLLAAGAAGLGLVLLRRRAGEHPAAAALALVPVAYLLHGLLDFDWDFAAVTGPALFAGGALLARPGGGPARRGVPGAALALAGAAAVFVSLLLPWLANRATQNAIGVDPARAISLARSARSLDPLAVEPVFEQADAEYSLGRKRQALELYQEATRIQPDDKETWFRLGQFEYATLACPRHALPDLERFTELDPQGVGGEVYRAALAAVDSGKPTC